jgi:PHD/YefM family antitoxin component YafN of YafNO toxin-antitoxin module
MSVITMPVSDVRKTMNALLGRLTKPVYVTQRGRVRAVLISVDTFNAMLDELQDAQDARDPILAREIEEARAEIEQGKGTRLEDVLHEYGL